MEQGVTCGWCGRILQVDLTAKRSEIVPLDMEIAQRFLGGRGLNSWTLYQEVKSDIDEFSPQNPLILAAGPLCGTLVPAANKFTFTAKSPLTNIFADSCAGGYLGPELKYAGFDQVLIKGQTFPLDPMLDEYYAERGWGMDGLQTCQKLMELDLEEVAEELAALKVLSE